MTDDPLRSVYAYVERAYVRLEAGDLLTRCMDEASASPVHEMVEGLVMAGPQSLQALREVLAEANQRKAQVQDDLNQLYQNLEKTFSGYGIRFDQEILPKAVALSPEHFRQLLIGQQVDDEAQVTCLQIIRDSQDLVENLSSRICILSEIETYLQDWLWGLAYQSVRQIFTPVKESASIPAQ